VCIVATGTENIHLNVPGENHYANFGISYCIKCDHSIVKNKQVVIVGENDEALRGALTVQPIAKSTTIILRNQNYNQNLLAEVAAFGVKTLINYQILEVIGDPYSVKEIVLLSPDQEIIKYPVEYIFVEIGYAPATTFIHDRSIINHENNALIVDQNCQTAIPGIYGIGDVIDRSTHQISGAVSNAKIATEAIINYLTEDFERQRAMEIRIKKS
jgi:thioredoxin reductase (NADPH)